MLPKYLLKVTMSYLLISKCIFSFCCSKKGFKVRSFGSGTHVKLPGPSPDKPNVYDFNTTYEEMYEDLTEKDRNLYLIHTFTYIYKTCVLALCTVIYESYIMCIMPSFGHTISHTVQSLALTCTPLGLYISYGGVSISILCRNLGFPTYFFYFYFRQSFVSFCVEFTRNHIESSWLKGNYLYMSH